MDESEVTSIVENHDGITVNDVFEVKGRGEVNKIFIVSAGTKKYVLRLDPNESSIQRFFKEKWCMEAASKQGILVPDVFKIELYNNQPYMLMEYIEGISGDSVEGDKSFIWKKLGEYARLIQQIDIEGYGEEMTEPGIFKDSWGRFIQYNISQTGTSDKAVAMGLLTLEDSNILKSIFLELAESPPTLNLFHYDLSLDNVIIKDDVVYLIDWGSAQVGPAPYLDIAEILHSSLDSESDEFNEFLAGYGWTRSEFKSCRNLITRVDLLMQTDKLRWALDCRTDLIPQFTDAVKQRLTSI